MVRFRPDLKEVNGFRRVAVVFRVGDTSSGRCHCKREENVCILPQFFIHEAEKGLEEEREEENVILTLYIPFFHDLQIAHRITMFEFTRNDVGEDLEFTVRMSSETFRRLNSILRQDKVSVLACSRQDNGEQEVNELTSLMTRRQPNCS